MPGKSRFSFLVHDNNLNAFMHEANHLGFEVGIYLNDKNSSDPSSAHILGSIPGPRFKDVVALLPNDVKLSRNFLEIPPLPDQLTFDQLCQKKNRPKMRSYALSLKNWCLPARSGLGMFNHTNRVF